MADWNDTRQDYRTAVGAAGAVAGNTTIYDEGLRKHMLSIYNYMSSGVLLSAAVAMIMYMQGWAEAMFFSPLRFVVALSPLAIIFAMSFGRERFSAATLQVMFWTFAALMGASLSTIFVVYTSISIAVAFLAAAAAFAGLSLYGYTTQRNITAWGGFLLMGLIGLIVVSVANWWLQSPTLFYAVGAIGVLIFAGLTAWNTQMLKREYVAVAASPWGQTDKSTYLDKAAINGALNLYLDFINLFMMLLRFVGVARSN